MNYLNQLLSIFRQFTRPVLSHIKNSLPVLLTLGFILLFVGIWTYGSSWTFSGISNEEGWDYELAKQVKMGSRIMATVVVLLTLAVIVILKLQLKNIRLNKEKNALEKEQEEKDIILPYIKEQDDNLELMSEALKNHLSHKDYIYQLPWYMVIGSNEAGKTSFINRSNQKFTLTTAEKTSKRYMRENCLYKIDWWASDDAILLDPEGGMIQQLGSEKDLEGKIAKELWLHLLDWICDVRPQRPINGIILVIDLPKLIASNHSDRQALAVLLRNRIREVTEQFGARVPVYVVLNKTDLIEGFETFYRDLKQDERYKNLGFSFTLNTDEQIDKWTKELSDSYIAFVKDGGTQTDIIGSSIGGGRILIKSINGFDTEFAAETNTLVVVQKDVPGVISEISSILAQNKINIAVMKVSRTEKGGTACCVIETDSPVDSGIKEKLDRSANVVSVTVIDLQEKYVSEF